MKRTTFFWLLASIPFAAPVAAAEETLTLEQVVSRVVENYPALDSALLEIERARQERPRVESLLGWTVGGQAGVARDAGFLGGTADVAEAGAALTRRLRSGDSVSVQGNYAREDTSVTFSPLFPNPSETTRLDLSYRQPLGRGAGNPEYTQGLVAADAQVLLAAAARRSLLDQLARQAADLYFASTFTLARIRSAEQAIDRAERLQAFIRRNAELGLTEAKDLLQAEAQLRQRAAEQRSLVVRWREERSALNRLMGRPAQAEFLPASAPPVVVAAGEPLLAEAERHSPDLARLRARVQLAEAAIARTRDARRNDLDLVYSIGNRMRSGDTAAGDIDESDVVGGVRLEYTIPFDRRGLDAEIRQAQLERDIALQDMETVRYELRYALESLLGEIEAARDALAAERRRLTAERRKREEAEARYRAGRIDTQSLIQFEADFHSAVLAVEQAQAELSRRLAELDLLRGGLLPAAVLADGPAAP